jgi:hypothetical protein
MRVEGKVTFCTDWGIIGFTPGTKLGHTPCERRLNA